MASVLEPRTERPASGPGQRSDCRHSGVADAFLAVLAPLASLRLTVILLALSAFLVFSGTMAQTQYDIWHVVWKQYFRVWVAKIELQAFLPPAFFPKLDPVPGHFYFPGGWTLGVLLSFNLLAAHAMRFTVQSRGRRLWGGLAVMAAGGLLTWAIVMGGPGTAAMQTEPIIPWARMWTLLRIGIAAGTVALVLLGLPLASKKERFYEFLLLQSAAGVGALTTILLLWLGSDFQLGESSMRILWQLLQGTAAGGVLLAGAVLAFKQRAGIVVLHLGVALLMGNEVLVHVRHSESQMRIVEGQSVNFAIDVREPEFAFIRHAPAEEKASAERKQQVFVLRKFPTSATEDGGWLTVEGLPVSLRIREWHENATIEPLYGESTTSAPIDAVAENQFRIVPAPRARGTSGSSIDLPACVVEIRENSSEQTLARCILSVEQSMYGRSEKVRVGDETWHVQLRFRRNYKPYTVRLNDVAARHYPGTSRIRDYSSYIDLKDPSRGIERKNIRVWMNNPLRFGGETFYQSGYDPGDGPGTEITVLQVVANEGWMLPYVACMIVLAGMLHHFSLTLLRFLNRRARETGQSVRTASNDAPAQTDARGRPLAAAARAKHVPVPAAGPAALPSTLADWIVPGLVGMILAAWVLNEIRARPASAQQFDYVAAGRIPILDQGRIKPLEAYARNTLRTIAGVEELKFKTKIDGKKKTQTVSAMQWMWEVAADTDAGRNYPLFKIDNPDVLRLLELERIEDLRYSIDQVMEKVQTLDRERKRIERLEPADRSIEDRRIMELVRRVHAFRKFQAAFLEPPLPEIPREGGPALVEFFTQLQRLREAIEENQFARIVPVTSGGGDGERAQWVSFPTAFVDALTQVLVRRNETPQALNNWRSLRRAYAQGDKAAFNKAVDAHLALTRGIRSEDFQPRRVDFEAFFVRAMPFYYSAVLYLIAFLCVAGGWLGMPRLMNRSAAAVLLVALVLHTLALAGRIYISGRPPVTNLYSSAVFIGWGCVALSLAFEAIFGKGIGNMVASICGFATLLIAHFLAGLADGGETITVLEAVLDTQFWLATHVVTISLGYATTFVAAVLGGIYVLRGVATKSLTPEIGRSLYRMIYGTLCFAILFSFWGTVLGGLWADDSWGRFWGWDPKENGALLIVLWNAIVLHARWGGLVKERGLAVLAIFGGVVTAWSWFGVNELGVGLHSYGFTEGVLRALALYAASQVLLMGLGSLPRRWWRSASAGDGAASANA